MYVGFGVADGRLWRLRQVRAVVAPAVDEVAVVDAGRHRLDGVEIGREIEGRLRLPDSHHALRRETAEQLGARGVHGLAGLLEDAVRVAVARMAQRGVASRVGLLDAPGTVGGGNRSRHAVDPARLRVHADVGHAGAHHRRVAGEPGGRSVDAAGDVQPFDGDGPVELLGVDWSVDDDPGGVRRRAGRRHVPLSVLGQRGLARVRGRRARDEVLGLLVADLRQREQCRAEEGDATGRQDRPLDRCGGHRLLPDAAPAAPAGVAAGATDTATRVPTEEASTARAVQIRCGRTRRAPIA